MILFGKMRHRGLESYASLHKAVLVSKDRAVRKRRKQRKRVATHYGATVGNVVVQEPALATA